MSEEAAVEGQLISKEPSPAGENNATISQSEGNGEEEYEIEAILEARRNMFAKTRMGYLVKWKNYEETENSWVDEKDAVGATELIREYWARRPKQQVNSSPKDKGSKSRGRARKSEGPISTRSVPSKRVLSNEQSDSEAESASNGNNKKMRLDNDELTDDENRVYAASVKDLIGKRSWEKLVGQIETVEKDSNGMLTVYFVLSNGVRCREDSRIARSKFPDKLFDFYETKIAWRDTEGNLIGKNAQPEE